MQGDYTSMKGRVKRAARQILAYVMKLEGINQYI